MADEGVQGVGGKPAGDGGLFSALKGLLSAVFTATMAGIFSLFLVGAIQDWTDGYPIRVFEGWTLFDLRVVGSLSAFFAVIALAGMVLFALPLTAIFAKKGLETWWTYPLAGLLTGGGIGFLLFTPTTDPLFGFSWLNLLNPSFVGGASGLGAGVIWWSSYRKKQGKEHAVTSVEGGS